MSCGKLTFIPYPFLFGIFRFSYSDTLWDRNVALLIFVQYRPDASLEFKLFSLLLFFQLEDHFWMLTWIALAFQNLYLS